ncbi:hypothetical protein AB0L63_32250 [Nocardia sp. NPDC051990]|uniref:RNA polymerase sigma factor n=1 Tax=Nocardia sp. NPDC051990 TaxID=3155285 RepID=UPI0034231F7C
MTVGRDTRRFFSDRFNELFRCHAPAVFRLVYSALNGDVERANDIVQEVFLAV